MNSVAAYIASLPVDEREQRVRTWRVRQLALRGHRQPKWDTLPESDRAWWRQQYQAWIDRGAPPLPN